MKQIFHIFRKDIRYHWIVILLCQMALALYCWEEVSSWRERADFGVSAFAGFIGLLPPLTWCFFVFRIVQDESLVGDRQFWVTRPYEWKKLLAEKALLVLVFLNLPLLIAGALLLAKAGFSPMPHLLGLLSMQFFLFLVPLLPLLALASVTRTLAPAIVTLLAVILFMASIVALPLFFQGGARFAAGFGITFSAPRTSGSLESLVIVLASLAAIGLQYARRKTAQSRLWLVGGLLATVALTLVSAYARRNRDPFPIPDRQTIAFHASLDPVKLLPPKSPAEADEAVPIGIPVRAWGVPSGSLGAVRGMRVVLEGPGGLRWDGRWHNSMQLLGPDDNRWRPVYEMEYETYQRLKSVPLKAYVSMSVDVFRERDSETLKSTGGEFAVPGVGRCSIWGRDRRSLRCSSPLAQPSMVVVRMDPAASTCPAEDAGPQVPVYGLPYAWERGRTSGTEGGISPVAPSFFSFWYFNDRANICPGTPLNFSFPQFAENVRSDFTIGDFHLDDYRQATFASDPIRGADGVRLGLPPPPR
jgi:hypothetical protein